MLSSDFQIVKEFLDQKTTFYKTPEFIGDDPISIPHSFTKKEDIEISAFFAATLAWGKRCSTIRSAQKLINLMDDSPFDFISNFEENDLRRFEKFVHRTFNSDDCIFFMTSLQNIYKNHGGLENVFTAPGKLHDEVIFHSIVHFRQMFLQSAHMQRSEKHISNPAKNATAKRLNMFLRWMVRQDSNGVDFGIWKSISPGQLICPLDVHSGNSARKLGILTRKTNDWKAATELTQNLRLFAPDDPVKYDFALFGLGVFERF